MTSILKAGIIFNLSLYSILPLFPDPFHPEKYGGEFRRVNFWEWLYKEIWELGTGIELKDKSALMQVRIRYGCTTLEAKRILKEKAITVSGGILI